MSHAVPRCPTPGSAAAGSETTPGLWLLTPDDQTCLVLLAPQMHLPQHRPRATRGSPRKVATAGSQCLLLASHPAAPMGCIDKEDGGQLAARAC
ncbi:hypothetical protein G7Z17_g11631 [Cylindrodendrum hubeiense]|uniref:Uncharacterized protein n=1 Tax=Cylindrodendrum hubeiense TaxID=595255 RepID=A0A9P5LB41_9HYPO|nr:hypothetical protein G7Z17_g11631 [Cylindrodendrum hubeiense]